MNDWVGMFGGLTVILFIVALVLIGPFLGIWGINTLFPAANIPYNISTWFAMICFSGIFRTTVSVNKKG